MLKDEYTNHPFRHPICWLEDHTSWFSGVLRFLYRTRRVIRNPRMEYYEWRKWHSRPKVGDTVWCCDGRQHTVIKIGPTGDDLWMDDGASYSWMNCCSWERE